MDKGHYQIAKKDLPKHVEQAWFYTGKESSIHIVLKPAQATVFCNGHKRVVEVELPQINMDLPSIRKAKALALPQKKAEESK